MEVDCGHSAGAGRTHGGAGVPQIPRRRIRAGEQTALQHRVIVECRHNRTLEVRGSIPLGSTRKRKGLAAMRGLFVFGPQTDRPRIEKMLEALNAITDGRGSKMFLFLDQASLAASNPLDVQWLTGKGGRMRLCD